MSRLPRYLALAYALLVIYASLHPFTGWRDLGVSPLAFLDAAWPRYWTGFDLITNVLAYLPLGFLLALALGAAQPRWWRRLLAGLAAVLLAAALSFTLEALQTWLPSRVSSNLDFACNALGGLLGALLGYLRGDRLLLRLGHWQPRLLAAQPHAEFGITLLALWLFAQLSPDTLLFGSGAVRNLLGLPPVMPFEAPLFHFAEMLIVACNVLAVGLFARSILAERWTSPLVLTAFFLLAMTIKSLAAATLIGPDSAFAWATPGARQGLGIGVLALALCYLLPAGFRLALAGSALMVATVLINLAPDNPYAEALRQGHFLNFNGLTRLVASLWPFLAPSYLLYAGRRQTGR